MARRPFQPIPPKPPARIDGSIQFHRAPTSAPPPKPAVNSPIQVSTTPSLPIARPRAVENSPKPVQQRVSVTQVSAGVVRTSSAGTIPIVATAVPNTSFAAPLAAKTKVTPIPGASPYTEHVRVAAETLRAPPKKPAPLPARPDKGIK
jgi:hypothetical protein